MCLERTVESISHDVLIDDSDSFASDREYSGRIFNFSLRLADILFSMVVKDFNFRYLCFNFLILIFS